MVARSFPCAPLRGRSVVSSVQDVSGDDDEQLSLTQFSQGTAEQTADDRQASQQRKLVDGLRVLVLHQTREKYRLAGNQGDCRTYCAGRKLQQLRIVDRRQHVHYRGAAERGE